MKKNVIALLLSVVLAVGGIGTAPAMAAETTAQETAPVQQEESMEQDASEETEDAEIAPVAEETSEGTVSEDEEASAKEVEEYVQNTEAPVYETEGTSEEDENATEQDEIPGTDSTAEAASEIEEAEEAVYIGDEKTTAEQGDTIPQETVVIACEGQPTPIEYSYELGDSVSFEVDLDLCIYYEFEDAVVDYTTNVARCMIFAYGAGEGIIKAIDGTGKVIKIFNIVIVAGTDSVTIPKGEYVWAYLPSSVNGVSWTESEGVSLTYRGETHYECSWGFLDLNRYEHLTLRDEMIAVKGEEIGDYTVKYYSGGSEDQPFYIVTYHVVENSGQDHPDDPDPVTEETVILRCGSMSTPIMVNHNADLSVNFDIDSDLQIEYRIDEYINDFETNTLSLEIYAYGAGEGTIKAVESATGNVIKTFHVVINPTTGVITDCKGNDIKVYLYDAPSGLMWTENDGVSVQDMGCFESTIRWETSDPDIFDYLYLQNHEYSVTGLKTGYHTVTFYVDSPEKPYYIGNYRIIDHDYHQTDIIEPTCAKEGAIVKECYNCHGIIREPIPVTDDHKWNTKYTVDREPTYDEEGIESIHCSVCGKIQKGSERSIRKIPKPINTLVVSGIENKIYQGQDVTLNIVVIEDDTALVEGVDYTVEYTNNSYVGKARVTVNGIGNYTGKVTGTFLILPGASSKVTCTNVASGIKVSWNKVDGATSYFVYRDDEFLFRTSALEVTDKAVKYNTGTKYTYRVVASTKDVGNSTKARTAKMFRLMPVGITKLTNPSAGKMTVTYDKCKGCYGYVVRYGLKSDMSDANVITVKGDNTLSRTFGGMKKGKTYYVQVRTYMLEFGVRYYSGYCTTKKITITK